MALIRAYQQFVVPFKDKISESSGIISNVWQSFFDMIRLRLEPLGIEQHFELKNNQATAQDISGLIFDFRSVSYSKVNYLIQRVTTATGAQELVDAGSFAVVYKPTAEIWSLISYNTTGSTSAGIVFSISATGQVKYTSTNITGTPSISKLTWRAQTMNAKDKSYSRAGA